MAATMTADGNWHTTSNQHDVERGLAIRNDYRDNRTIGICTAHRINEDSNGRPYRTFEMDGGKTNGGVIYNYTVRMNEEGILCDCPHHRTCKHCIYVLHYHVGVPIHHLRSTQMIKQELRKYFDDRFIVISD